jgi:hypothetical protein
VRIAKSRRPRRVCGFPPLLIVLDTKETAALQQQWASGMNPAK